MAVSSHSTSGNGKPASLLKIASNRWGRIRQHAKVPSPTAPPSDSLPPGRLLKIAEVKSRFGCSVGSLRRWHRLGLLKTVVLPSGHRRWSEDSLRDFLGMEQPSTNNGQGQLIIGVIRVSSTNDAQRSSMVTQRNLIADFVRKTWNTDNIVWNERTTSGFNWESPQLLDLCNKMLSGELRGGHICCSFPDRLMRTGRKILEWMAERGGVSIHYIMKEPPRDFASELTTELIDFCTSICNKRSGLKVRELYKRVMPADLLEECYRLYRSGLSFRGIEDQLKKQGRGMGPKGPYTFNIIRKNIVENLATLEKVVGSTPIENSLTRFFEEKITKEKNSRLPRAELIAAYHSYCVENGLVELSPPKVSRAMKPMGLRFRLDNERNTIIYCGIALKA
jgi:predicted site-specific integrase-resolvase